MPAGTARKASGSTPRSSIRSSRSLLRARISRATCFELEAARAVAGQAGNRLGQREKCFAPAGFSAGKHSALEFTPATRAKGLGVFRGHRDMRIASTLEIGFRGPQLVRHGCYTRTHSKGRNMANITRYDPFADLVDDFFRRFVVRPVGFESQVPV